MIPELLNVLKYSKTQRIKRIIEISMKGNNASPLEEMEYYIIQEIRKHNGEIEEVIKNREHQSQ